MKIIIHYSALALSDLDEIWDYIAADFDNVSAANRVINRILHDKRDYLQILFGSMA